MKDNQLHKSPYASWKKYLNKELVNNIENLNPDGVRFYYLNKNEAVVCFILIKGDNDHNILGCGASLKSPEDKFCEKEGRNKAAGRALKAIVNKENSEPIRTTLDQIPNTWNKRKIEHIINLATIFGYKSMYYGKLKHADIESVVSGFNND